SWRGSILRNLLRLVDFLPAGYALGLVWMSGSERFQRLGDLAAGTVVCYRQKQLLPDAGQLPEVDPVDPPAGLTLEEQGTIVRYAVRSREWTRSRNQELAALTEPITGTSNPDEGLQRLRGMAKSILHGS
ncbi:MAG: RDD family protein, partial [Bradymonadaceae bacterium]